MKADNSSIKKSNITETNELMPDGKRMTTSSVIRFNVTKSNDNSSIICSTKNEAMEQEMRTSIVLNVKYAPVVRIKTEPSTINEGDKVKFICTAKTNPGVRSYMWFKDGKNIIGVDTDTYEIESISRDVHNKKIKCQVFCCNFCKSKTCIF